MCEATAAASPSCTQPSGVLTKQGGEGPGRGLLDVRAPRPLSLPRAQAAFLQGSCGGQTVWGTETGGVGGAIVVGRRAERQQEQSLLLAENLWEL